MRRLAALFLAGTFLAAVPQVRPADAAGSLRQLALLRLPSPDSTQSGSVAFDGSSIYYAQSGKSTTTIYRLDPLTGKARPSFSIDVAQLWEMTYDGRRNHLYALSSDGTTTPVMYDADLATLKVREMFQIPDGLTDRSHWSYDATLDGFRVTTENTFVDGNNSGTCIFNCGGQGSGYPLLAYDRSGKRLSLCYLGNDSIVQNPSTIVAAGDGSSYIQDEDDETLFHVSEDCHLLGSGTHPKYTEAGENDSMACDTVTFPVPAVWIRDGAADAIVAFEVPGGYCPLPTKLAPVVGKDTYVGTSVPICTRLSLANVAFALANKPVVLSADGKVLGTATTDATGRACIGYVPRQVGKHTLAARYAGSRAYMPSSSIGALKALQPPAKPVRRRPPAVTYDPPQQQPIHLVPKPAPLPQVQMQPATQVQVQPHVQPQVQAQAVVVPQIQEQVQVARATVDTKQRDLAFTRYQPRRRTPTPLLPLAAGAVAVMGMAIAVGPAVSRGLARSHRRPS